MLSGQMENDGVIRDCEAIYGVLRDSHIFVLDLHVHIFAVRQNPFCPRQVQHPGRFACVKPVIDVIAQPDLQLAALNRVQLAAAVYERLGHMADFGNVKRGRNDVLTRQYQMKGLFGMGFEQMGKLADFHVVFFLVIAANAAFVVRNYAAQVGG